MAKSARKRFFAGWGTGIVFFRQLFYGFQRQVGAENIIWDVYPKTSPPLLSYIYFVISSFIWSRESPVKSAMSSAELPLAISFLAVSSLFWTATSIARAIAKAQKNDDSTIYLYNSVTLAETLNVTAGNFTLDL